MVPLKFDLTIALFLGIPLIVFFVLWIIFSSKEIKEFLEIREVWECEICLNVYYTYRNEEISKCPFCGSYNKRKTGEES